MGFNFERYIYILIHSRLYMKESSTVLLNKRIIEMLKKAKDNPRQTYNEILEKAVGLYLKVKGRDQYDKFLHEVQKPKMQEIWDNKYDEIWEQA